MKYWKILSKSQKLKVKSQNFQDKLVKILLNNRGLKNKKEIDEFFKPKLSDVTIKNVGINQKQLKKALKRIKKAIKDKEQIIIFGDYDVDGICGSAILWETLNNLGAKVMPYIPHRIEEGYGLSITGISNVKFQMPNVKLIVTVDNGIVANAAVEFANKNGVDVIITDHHVPGKKLPEAYSIVHTTKLCGAGVAWILANSLWQIANGNKTISNKPYANNHLELVALATIADLVPLLGANRTLTKYGLEELRQTKRVGLLELFKEAALESQVIDTYEVGHIIAPRLNAMGRIEHAMDSLRLLCTKDITRARDLAQKLGRTNRDRQQLTEETTLHAKELVRSQRLEVSKLLFVSHESYQQGVIGLVAGKLVEEFYRPAIVVSKGKEYSKASARSIHGFNIIEFIRSAQELLVDAGGHPMAAGFTVRTEKLVLLQEKLEERAKRKITDRLLERTLRVDCEIGFSDITHELYEKLTQFAPFGMGNPQPTFVTKGIVIEDMWVVGNDGKHLKLRLSQESGIRNHESGMFEAIAFGMGERAGEFHIGDVIDVVYIIEQDSWNNKSKLQLKIKDFRISSLH